MLATVVLTFSFLSNSVIVWNLIYSMQYCGLLNTPYSPTGLEFVAKQPCLQFLQCNVCDQRIQLPWKIWLHSIFIFSHSSNWTFLCLDSLLVTYGKFVIVHINNFYLFYYDLGVVFGKQCNNCTKAKCSHPVLIWWLRKPDLSYVTAVSSCGNGNVSFDQIVRYQMSFTAVYLKCCSCLELWF